MSTLYVDNLQPNLGSRVMAAGHVVQVVQATGTNATSIATSGVWTPVAGTFSITPTSSSSKIMVEHHAGGLAINSNTVGLRLKRNGIVVLENDRHVGFHNASTWGTSAFDLIYLDNPNSTTQVDYTLEVRIGGTGEVRHNDYQTNSNTWVSVLMEIAQ